MGIAEAQISASAEGSRPLGSAARAAPNRPVTPEAESNVQRLRAVQDRDRPVVVAHGWADESRGRVRERAHRDRRDRPGRFGRGRAARLARLHGSRPCDRQGGDSRPRRSAAGRHRTGRRRSVGRRGARDEAAPARGAALDRLRSGDGHCFRHGDAGPAPSQHLAAHRPRRGRRRARRRDLALDRRRLRRSRRRRRGRLRDRRPIAPSVPLGGRASGARP